MNSPSVHKNLRWLKEMEPTIQNASPVPRTSHSPSSIEVRQDARAQYGLETQALLPRSPTRHLTRRIRYPITKTGRVGPPGGANFAKGQNSSKRLLSKRCPGISRWAHFFASATPPESPRKRIQDLASHRSALADSFCDSSRSTAWSDG